ncbi:uncharacterized protein E0L32_002446 [Thyridium curvatum]|uniref:Uncharacterized protein n=1 Tax=Thyridium curvatum TaxID=1093900 RepID=A0A507BM60_9PEZI|nr:uncharacterized protein E0L32_002446 [Thyridium curvatum]TPX18589.1 hypothetical protein E0L32_002446 [Thyridium curvatum]
MKFSVFTTLAALAATATAYAPMHGRQILNTTSASTTSAPPTTLPPTTTAAPSGTGAVTVTDVFTVTYTELCPTGLRPVVYTIYNECKCWSPAKPTPPPAFTCVEVSCTACGAGGKPLTATVTCPVTSITAYKQSGYVVVPTTPAGNKPPVVVSTTPAGAQPTKPAVVTAGAAAVGVPAAAGAVALVAAILA